MSNITKPSTGGGGGGTLTSVVALNSTPQFVLTGTTETIDFGLTNLLIGSSGASISPGNALNNVGLGLNALFALIDGDSNVAVGENALASNTTGGSNTAIGDGALLNNVAGSNSTAIGGGALANVSSQGNIGIGVSSGGGLQNGINNILIGNFVASAYNLTESNNILIGNAGVNHENNALHIGTQGSGAGQQNINFTAGITGATPNNSFIPQVTLCDSRGNLTTISSSTAGFVLTSNGVNAPSFQAASGGNSASFSVTLSANQSGVTGNNTQYQVPYNVVEFDSASAYNASTHLYTFPFTGIYQLNTKTFLFGGSGLSGQFFQWASYNGGAYPGDRLSDLNPAALGLATNAEFLITASWLHSATAGDTIGIFIDVLGGSTADVGVAGGTGADAQVNCAFSGFLI